MPIEYAVTPAKEETFQNMMLFQEEGYLGHAAPQNRKWLPMNVVSMRQKPQVS